uniref:Uncharacterized protein n=1 Tax=Glypta fumiferanae TaxID=389681 RepID=A0A0F6QA49_9HYME|nr:hypothetical protein [Glypta fumiferanae]
MHNLLPAIIFFRLQLNLRKICKFLIRIELFIFLKIDIISFPLICLNEANIFEISGHIFYFNIEKKIFNYCFFFFSKNNQTCWKIFALIMMKHFVEGNVHGQFACFVDELNYSTIGQTMTVVYTGKCHRHEFIRFDTNRMNIPEILLVCTCGFHTRL